MTIYIPNLFELSQWQMSILAPQARFSVMPAKGPVTAYVYEWEDMKVVVHVMPRLKMASHVEEMIGWCQHLAAVKGRPLEEAIAHRLRSSTIILGLVVQGTTDREVWHERVQDLIAIICFNTGALLLWELALFNSDGQQILPRTA